MDFVFIFFRLKIGLSSFFFLTGLLGVVYEKVIDFYLSILYSHFNEFNNSKSFWYYLYSLLDIGTCLQIWINLLLYLYLFLYFAFFLYIKLKILHTLNKSTPIGLITD